MTLDDKKISFTLRMKKELSEHIEKEAKSQGVSKNAYINTALIEAVKQKIS